MLKNFSKAGDYSKEIPQALVLVAVSMETRFIQISFLCMSTNLTWGCLVDNNSIPLAYALYLILMDPEPFKYISQFDQEWKIGPTLMTLCEHLFVSFAIRILKQHATKVITGLRPKKEEADGETSDTGSNTAIVPVINDQKKKKMKFMWKAGIGNFVASGIVAYIDGRLCRQIPNPIARRIVSGFLLSFLEKSSEQ